MKSIVKDCTGVILAGGENIRMPVLKAFIEVEGEKIIEKNLKIMKHLFSEVFIVTNQPEFYLYLDTALLGDVYDVRGPMTGIFTALLTSSNKWVFITACDMPFIKGDLIKYMASKRDNYDAVVPKLKNRVEPLFAFYSQRLISPMEKSILTGKTGVQDFLQNKKVKYISIEGAEVIKDRAALAKSFINLNTPADIALYLKAEDSLKFKKNLARRKRCLV